MDANVVAGLGVVGAGVVAYALWLPLARRRLSTEQQARTGPETMELRAESPAIVNLLVNEVHPTGDAVAATILDLAARRYLDIIQLSPAEHLVVPRTGKAGSLAPYEERILEAIELAAGGAPHATVPAIADALRPGSADTWLRFKAEVIREAQRGGLVATSIIRWSKPLLLISLLPCVGLALAVPPMAVVSPIVYVMLLLAGLISLVIGHAYRLTDAGRAAGSHWLGVRSFIENSSDFDELPAGAVAVWDRYLAYGAAMGLSGAAVHGLVDELRTTLSLGDVSAIAGALGEAARATKEPGRARDWRLEQLQGTFGPEVTADDIYGPTEGDFWQLLEATGTGWRIAALTHSTDRALWRRATEARIAILEATAPPALTADVATLANAARRALTQVVGGGEDIRQRVATDPGVTGPAVRDALARLCDAVGARLGIDPSPETISEALARGPLRLDSLLG